MKEEDPQPKYEEAFVDVADARVHYLHAGSGKPILLIHGLVGSSANWRNNIDALAREGSVYAIDLMNTGRSQQAGELDAGLSTSAKRIISIMDALNLGEADVVAHSHGGAVALMLAAMRPRRVRKLILFAPANPYSRVGEVLVRIFSTRWGGLLARMLPYLPAAIQRIALGPMYGGPERVVDKCLQDIVAGLRNPDTLRHVLCVIRSWCADTVKLKAAIRRVKRMAKRIPILLVWGDRDCTVSLSSATQLKRKLRASGLIVLPGCGHSVFEENVEESNRIMLEWLGRDSLLEPRLRAAQRTPFVAARTGRTAAMRGLSPG